MNRRDFFRAACACATTAVVGPEVAAPIVQPVVGDCVVYIRMLGYAKEIRCTLQIA